MGGGELLPPALPATAQKCDSIDSQVWKDEAEDRPSLLDELMKIPAPAVAACSNRELRSAPMDDQGIPARSNGTAVADGGWQKELVDAVVSQVDEKLTNGGEQHESSSPQTPNDAGAVRQITTIPPTKEGRMAYLAEIDGPRPIVDGAALDNAVASFRANDVYVAAGTTSEVQVPVWMANSTVTVVKVGVDDEHSEGFDVGYGVSINYPGGGAKEKVIEADRRITTIGSELTFKVEQVPATVLLKFDNAYSWINSKKVQYHVEVEPPIDEEIIARSRRAEAAIDILAVELNKAKEGVAQIQNVRQSVDQKATEAKKKTEDCRKGLEAKIEEFQKSVKVVKRIEQTLKEKEVETENNEKTAAQMIDEKDQIQARIEELRKALQAAESELESKTVQIHAQQDLVAANKKDVLAMEEDIDNRLNGIEESGAKVKEMEALMKKTEESGIEASREQAIIFEEEGKATQHLKFYEKLFSDLKLRLMETPQEV